jgi:peptidoglycan DL-endopeptidase CwlO
MSRHARHRAPTKPLLGTTGVRVALTTTGALAAVPAALLATAGAAQAYTDNGDGTVTVQHGDTISAIARGAGQGTQAVLDRNGLGWRTTIHPGQRVALAGHGTTPVQRSAAPSRSQERAPLPVNTTGEAATALARQYIGTPYVWGGATPAAGFDCSGLVQYVYGRLGVSLPRTSAQMRSVGYAVSTPRVGDLVLFDDYGHVAIYAGNGRIVEAPKPGQAIHERDLWTTRVEFRRVA